METSDTTGYIKLFRSLKDWKWYDEPVALALWVHILIEANWKDGYWGKQNYIEVPRGSFVTSLVKLSKQMKCNRQTIRRWLDAFERDKMCACEYTSKYTRITVIKYDDFQVFENAGEHVNEQVISTKLASSEHVVSTIEERKKERIYLKEKENKKEKESATRFKKPTLEELQEFIKANRYNVDANRFLDYYESNGWMVGRTHMKDWKATVRNWHRKAQESGKPQGYVVERPAYTREPKEDKELTQEDLERIERMKEELEKMKEGEDK